MKQMTRHNIILITVVIFAFFFRIYNLDSVPPSLHGDEVGVGYNAYSLLTAGIDEYGKKWPVVLRADVAPAIFYATIPSIALFGLTEFAVRFPSSIVGIATIIVFYVFVKELFFKKKKRDTIALISTALLAFSPWHIQISRIAHDAPYGLLLQLVALTFFLKGISRNKSFFLILSSILFGTSFYAYHSPRLTTPLLLIILLWLYRKKMLVSRKTLAYGAILFILTVTPITVDFLAKPIAQTRFGGINIFIRGEQETTTPRYLSTVSLRFITNYLNQFNFRYLFFDTSQMRYFHVQNVGLLYLVQAPFVLFGLFFLSKQKRYAKQLLSLWILIAILPGALTLGQPNGGRIFMLILPLQIVAAVGITELKGSIGGKIQKKIYEKTVVIVFAVSAVFFMRQYFSDAPTRFLPQWQYGFKEMALFVTNREENYDHIIITDKMKQAYIYILFYGQKDPKEFAEQLYKKRHSFIGYKAFGKYEFRKIDWQNDTKLQNVLIIATKEETPTDQATLSEVTYPNGEALLKLIAIN